jgi:hypothetical protein
MTLREFVSRLVKEHIVDEFPYPSCCFDCDAQSCEECEKVREEVSGNADKVREVRLV